MSNGNGIDFSGADEQQSREVLAENTLVCVCMHIKRGGHGADGWLSKSKVGDSLGLSCKFVVIDGEHKGHAIFNRFTLSGTTDGHREAARISGASLRAILESVNNVKPDPTKSDPAWLKATHVNSYGDFHGLCFLAKLGVAPPKDGYPAKNIIKTIVTPNMPGYFRVEPVPVAAPASAPATSAPSTQMAIPLPGPSVTAAERPSWAK